MTKDLMPGPTNTQTDSIQKQTSQLSFLWVDNVENLILRKMLNIKCKLISLFCTNVNFIQRLILSKENISKIIYVVQNRI